MNEGQRIITEGLIEDMGKQIGGDVNELRRILPAIQKNPNSEGQLQAYVEKISRGMIFMANRFAAGPDSATEAAKAYMEIFVTRLEELHIDQSIVNRILTGVVANLYGRLKSSTDDRPGQPYLGLPADDLRTKLNVAVMRALMGKS